MLRLHATCIAIDGRGVLLRGASGAGKSDLALRLIDQGADLVADDQVDLFDFDGRLTAAAPATIAGRMEVRGIGVIPMPYLPNAEVVLLVDLVPPDAVERMPEPSFHRLGRFDVPALALAPFEASAAAKIRLAVRQQPRRPAASEDSAPESTP